MSNIVPSPSPRICTAIIISLATVGLSGCAHPLGLKVIDSGNGMPIAGARVTRWKLCLPPFWVVGPILPVEHCETDDHGLAHLKDSKGSIMIEAAGYERKYESMVDEGGEIVIPLVRVADDGKYLPP